MRFSRLRRTIARHGMAVILACTTFSLLSIVAASSAVAQTAGDNQPGAAPGGAAMADFQSLIALIESTIDPDGWQNAGGTSSMQPYPAGVYVDPTGQLKRQAVGDVDANFANSRRGGPRHPWRSESKQRIISLRSLDAALESAQRFGIRPSLELQKLAGLERIEFVKIDAANEDILIAGPAGTGLGFQLGDLAVVASLVKVQTEPLGCSIEPSDAGILAAQQMLSAGDAIAQLAKTPQRVVDRMQEKIGPHNVRVFGMSAQTGTAIALIDADEHMKRVGFGTVATEPKIRSYFDFLDRQATVPQQSLIRWWFAYANEPILSNSQQDLFQLPQHCVQVMSEQQWVTGQGRAPTGKQDAAADAFAAEMTKHIPELRRSMESYARTVAVFESALALQLGLEATGQPSLDAWFPNLVGFGHQQADSVDEPKTVGGLTTWHELRNGTIVAVVSGGVKVDSYTPSRRDNWTPSKYLATSSIAQSPVVPSAAHAQWWWD